ncbi:sigma-70 family RNA polymerase sigma factor [Singulisphaera sp. PoT]|uniref:sigma-70 family RNA polymerase sigma factor n=1 Tax=Singulisphaera sp. PoT TaxID=3411797 RepID=UPI003BF59365
MRDVGARTSPGPDSWRTLIGAGTVAGLSDGMLLERFAARRDDASEAAFAALVARHGPMVRKVCRRLLDASPDADDAFQATFLILARKAGAIRSPERLANWLYGTAYQASRKLRVRSARRRKHEASAALAVSDAVLEPSYDRDGEVILEEVSRLPEICRLVVVLCAFEGLSQEDAAQRLGCSDRTLRRHWARARDLLRERLTRRGLAPAVVAFGASLAPEAAPAALPEALVAAVARAALTFATGGSLPRAGAVSASAIALAEGVIQAMLWTKIKGLMIAATVLLTLSVGAGLGVGGVLASSSSGEARTTTSEDEDKVSPEELPPAEQYRALVKRYDDAIKVYQEAASKAKSPEEVSKLYERLGPFPKDYTPLFVALAERYPRDPVAADSLFWVLDKSLGAWDSEEHPFGDTVNRALLAVRRDHGDDPRLGPLCLQFVLSPSLRREALLRELAAEGSNRVVRGQATLALAESLRMKALMATMIQKPHVPLDLDELPLMPEPFRREFAKVNHDDSGTFRRDVEKNYAKRSPKYLEELRTVDVAKLRQESRQLGDRILAEYADVPYVRIDKQPTRETLRDIVLQGRRPGPLKFGAEGRFKELSEGFRAQQKKADAAMSAVGTNAEGFKAYVAAAPKWADYGPGMWEIAESAPNSPAGMDALFWLLRNHIPFFDAREERAEMVGKVVDVLIQDHLDWIGENLASRRVAEGFGSGGSMPSPHIDRLLRTLYERAQSREARGRSGLALARHLKAQADLAEGFAASGADPAKRPEVLMWAPSFLAWLERKGPRELDREAEAILEKVKAEYGDVKQLNGMVVSDETIATVADRELEDIRSLGVGEVAPEIEGEDVEGRRMTLSEFRGKVVLLDFGSHEHCGGCRVLYPRLREIVDQYRGRPFVVLGVNTSDKRDVLKDLHAKREITWRSWWDGDDPDDAGPITLRWNIPGYPTFVVLDHRGRIRFKDLHPQDGPRFAEAIEGLLKEADGEAARP